MATGLASVEPDPKKDPWAWAQWARQRDPGTYDYGTVGFSDDPYQVKANRKLLEQQGLWKPEWNEWANYQAPTGDSSGPAEPATPDFSSLNGYKVGGARGPGHMRYAELIDPTGKSVGVEGYERRSTGLKDYAQAAAIVGGAAFGMNAAFGGLGGAAAGGAAGEGLTLANSAGGYGGFGSLGSPSLLTGGTLGTSTAGLAGGAAGYGGLGVTAGGLAAGATGAAGAAPTVGSGAWNGTNFTGTTPLAGSSNLGTGASAMSTFGDWIQLGGLVNSVFNRPDAPDTSGMNAAAQANASIAGRQEDLAEKTYADQMALFNEFKPMLVQQMQSSITEQGKSTARADDQWNNYLTTFRPAEQALVDKSMNWASDSRMTAEANRAGSAVAGQFDRARADTTQTLAMAGASPEKIAALTAAGRLEEAKAVGGAQGNARREVQQQGMAYLDNAARFGRNMTSTGLAAAGLASQQGAQATQGYGNLADASSGPAASASPLFQSAVSANNSAGSLFGNVANVNAQSNLQDYNATMGTLAGLNKWGQSGSSWFGSSKKTKHRKGKVDGKKAGDAVEKSGAEKWAYKDGLGDGNTKDRMGPMAEDLKRVAPEVSDGERVDAIAMAGLHHAAIGGHNREIRDLKKQVNHLRQTLSLADA